MDVSHPDRRLFLTALMAALGVPTASLTKERIIDLDWSDLVPAGESNTARTLQGMGVIPHDEMTALRAEQPQSSSVRTDYNGKIARIPGYVVPLEKSGSGITAFILVPYIGACIHVPPPPANQLVFVTTSDPYDGSGMFEAVNVTGMFLSLIHI